ncbi:chromate transporter [Neobacillus cucumis]|uniref:chromate transporter n=1 Tax=Neobacillus cucumis TaxID=1740721 RepID=UPI0028533688|nr:chromate transporter [Neobacillus cucumis]MDR4947623.1 chromate transporter [Neobacillus cucumis]
MIYLQIFFAFFIPNIVGYGGGPASIPLIEHEVVNRYGWVTTSEFSEILALGNSLPGPIATKMAGYIGFEVGGAIGAVIAEFATIAPSLILMIVLLQLIFRHKDSPRVKRLSKIVVPTVAILMAGLTFDFFQTSISSNGVLQTIIIAIISLLLLEKWKVHPAFVIVGGLAYGAIFLS